MPSLDRQQLREFLIPERRILKLATPTPEGWPYIDPLWYDYDGEAFIVFGRRKVQWVSHIRNDARVSLCIDTCEPPYTRILVRATAEILDMNWFPTSPDKAIRYLGQEAGRRYFEETRSEPRALVRIVPSEIVTWTGASSPKYNE